MDASLGRGRGSGGGPAWTAGSGDAPRRSASRPARHAAGAGSIRRRWTFSARRQHWGTRVRAVALRHHRHRPRRTAIRRPQQRHGVARRHQRYHLDDASALRIDDHPDFFAGGIDRTQRIGRALAHRATHRLEAGRAHDRHDLMRRQSRAGIDGTGIDGRWCGLRQSVSGYRERGDKSRAEGDLVLQDKVPPIWLFPVRCLRSTRQRERNAAQAQSIAAWRRMAQR